MDVIMRSYTGRSMLLLEEPIFDRPRSESESDESSNWEVLAASDGRLVDVAGPVNICLVFSMCSFLFFFVLNVAEHTEQK